MSLSVIVPVWNEPQGVARLLVQLREMQIADQVIIADDGSDIPCSAALVADVSRRQGAALPLDARDPVPGAEVLWLRTPTSRGAGHARNLGAAQARGSHVLFFDADDALTEGLTTILDDLEGQEYDFALFRHHDSRVLSQGGTGPLEPDASYWAATGAETRAAPLTPRDALQLCRIAAYPWNKIWNRAFLEREKIRCTEIPVHNDIAHHWSGFLSAQRILVTRRVGCIHHVEHGRGQLTNRRNSDRLRVFEAIEEVIDRFVAVLARQPARAEYAAPLLDFILRLLHWIERRLDGPEAQAALLREKALFLRRLAAPSRDILAPAIDLALLRNPSLARRAAPELERAA